MNNIDQETVKFTQYLKDIDKTKFQISRYSITNLFNVVKKGSLSYYNICTTLNFKNLDKIPSSKYTLYIVRSKDTWTNISFKQYGTIQLWWVLCKFNNIKNPFQQLSQSTIIKIPTAEFINNILQLLE